MTCGEFLAHRISFAVNSAVKIIQRLSIGLTDLERYAVVLEMKKYGDPWKLDEELPKERITGAGMPSGWQGK